MSLEDAKTYLRRLATDKELAATRTTASASTFARSARDLPAGA